MRVPSLDTDGASLPQPAWLMEPRPGHRGPASLLTLQGLLGRDRVAVHPGAESGLLPALSHPWTSPHPSVSLGFPSFTVNGSV